MRFVQTSQNKIIINIDQIVWIHCFIDEYKFRKINIGLSTGLTEELIDFRDFDETLNWQDVDFGIFFNKLVKWLSNIKEGETISNMYLFKSCVPDYRRN